MIERPELIKLNSKQHLKATPFMDYAEERANDLLKGSISWRDYFETMEDYQDASCNLMILAIITEKLIMAQWDSDDHELEKNLAIVNQWIAVVQNRMTDMIINTII